MDTQIAIQIKKRLPDNIAEYHLQALRKYQPNEWFTPSNKAEREDYDICDTLGMDNHFICRRILPIWHDGSHRGNKVQFLYNEEMDYTNTPA